MTTRDTPAFQYECSNGHEIASRSEIVQCPAARCDGQLRRFGRGSRPTERER